MWFSAQDLTSLIGGLSLYLASVRACGYLAHASLAQVPTLAFAVAALGVSSSYVVYALVWFNTEAFVAGCKRLPLRWLGSGPIGVFQTLVLSFKLFQQLVLVGWVVRAVGGDLTDPSSWYASLRPLFLDFAADPPRVAVAMLLLVAGQALNAGIYAAIGKEGVYYGFKLGARVPWVTGFPFNLGYRHPAVRGWHAVPVRAVRSAVVPPHAGRRAALAARMVDGQLRFCVLDGGVVWRQRREPSWGPGQEGQVMAESARRAPALRLRSVPFCWGRGAGTA